MQVKNHAPFGVGGSTKKSRCSEVPPAIRVSPRAKSRDEGGGDRASTDRGGDRARLGGYGGGGGPRVVQCDRARCVE